MASSAMLASVKAALGIEGTYQDATISVYIDEVTSFVTDAGVSADSITSGLVARGVSDLWNYGAGEGKFSDYFRMRVSQLSYKGAPRYG
jgi:hypothetical protein